MAEQITKEMEQSMLDQTKDLNEIMNLIKNQENKEIVGKEKVVEQLDNILDRIDSLRSEVFNLISSSLSVISSG